MSVDGDLNLAPNFTYRTHVNCGYVANAREINSRCNRANVIDYCGEMTIFLK